MLRISATSCAVLPTLLVAACGGDGPGAPVDDPPEVIAVNPALGEGVGLLQEITVRFSEPVNPATVNAQTVTVTPMAGSLRMACDEDGRTLWIAPDSLYPPETDLTLSLTSGITDLAGNPLEPHSVGFRTGPFECEFLADRFEPNDGTGEPLDVAPDSLVTGLSTCMGDEDYFRVTITDTLMLTARTHLKYADSVSWGIHWIRADGQAYGTLGTWGVTGKDVSYRYTFLPGSYYLHAFGYDDEELVLYDLIFETGTPCADDPYEDNDFEDEAASVSPGTLTGLRGCYVDMDWFSFPVTAGQIITLTVDPGGYTGTRRLIIREPGGEQSGVTGGQSLTSTTLTATSTGTALVHARFWADDVTYDLTIGVSG